MRISRRKPVGQTGPVSPVTPRKPAEGKVEGATRSEERAADVDISHSSREIDGARETLAAMPDVRAERVEQIKPIVDDGSYQVDSKVLAKKVVDSSLRESAHEKKGKGGKR